MIEAMSEAAISRDWIGRFADGRFPLLKWLGGSQPSGVFLTELEDPTHRSDHSQPAVIKLVPAEVEDAEARAAAWQAATTLSHPNLMRVYTHGRCEIDDVPCLYVVTEFADEVLAEILFERPLTTKETREMLGPALDALSYLHANGLVHGRLNPSNIMAAGDSLKLTTYSVCSVGAAVTSGSTRTVCDAPETENESIGPASDVWSLGATIVEVLTKYPPQWNRARTADPTVPESMPEPFASIARKCLRSDPARRITLDEIAVRLDPARLLSGPSPSEKPATASSHRRRIAIPLAFGAVALAGVGILYTLSHRVQPPQNSPAPAQQSQNVPAATPAPAPVATPAASPASNPVGSPSPATTPPPLPSRLRHPTRCMLPPPFRRLNPSKLKPPNLKPPIVPLRQPSTPPSSTRFSPTSFPEQ